MSLITYFASFDGNDLAASVPGLTVLASDPYHAPKRTLTLLNLARTNKSKNNSGFYTEKPITVRVGISQATRDLVESSLDTLYSLLQGLEKNLQLKQAGAIRQYIATYQDAVFLESGGSYVQLNLIFTTVDRFGYDLSSTLLLQTTNYTSYQKTDRVAVGGSAPWQQPTYTITLSALTAGTSQSVSIGNDNSSQLCTVTRTWAAGDVIEISAPNQTVKVNGVEVAFAGAIPEFAPGVGYLTYRDTLGSRTMSMTATYCKRYV